MSPHSGPGRAERAKKTLLASQGHSRRKSRASPWLGRWWRKADCTEIRPQNPRDTERTRCSVSRGFCGPYRSGSPEGFRRFGSV